MRRTHRTARSAGAWAPFGPIRGERMRDPAHSKLLQRRVYSAASARPNGRGAATAALPRQERSQ